MKRKKKKPGGKSVITARSKVNRWGHRCTSQDQRVSENDSCKTTPLWRGAVSASPSPLRRPPPPAEPPSDSSGGSGWAAPMDSDRTLILINFCYASPLSLHLAAPTPASSVASVSSPGSPASARSIRRVSARRHDRRLYPATNLYRDP